MKAAKEQDPPAVSHPCLACRQCGLVLESFALRCPRCLEPLPLGCNGNCKECGKLSSRGGGR